MSGRILLVSDVDGTLLGDEAATERFAAWCRARGDGLLLVYASGRFFASVVESIRTTSLPRPHAIIGGVGTDIRLYPSGDVLSAWHRSFDSAWNAGRVREVLAGEPGLVAQPAEFQSAHKVSYFLPDASGTRLRELDRKLSGASIPADVIYSSRRDLDVVPAGANKGTAAAFLARTWDLSWEQVMVSGDSGNDLALFRQGFRGIVPANGHEELKALPSATTYQAAAPYAAGVLEGLEYWDKAVGRA